MKFYFQEGIPGYGERIYLSKSIRSHNKIYEICKALCSWSSVDKHNEKEYWNSFEFPPIKDIDFKQLILKYSFNSEFVSWEEFLQYCSEEKIKEGL